MSWSVELTPEVAKTLRRLDSRTSKRLRRALTALETLEDLRVRGEALTGTLRGIWRYRVGDYRIVCDLIDNRLAVLEIGHRSTIRKR